MTNSTTWLELLEESGDGRATIARALTLAMFLLNWRTILLLCMNQTGIEFKSVPNQTTQMLITTGTRTKG